MSEKKNSRIVDLMRKSVGLQPAKSTGCCGSAASAVSDEEDGPCCGSEETTGDCEPVRPEE